MRVPVESGTVVAEVKHEYGMYDNAAFEPYQCYFQRICSLCPSLHFRIPRHSFLAKLSYPRVPLRSGR